MNTLDTLLLLHAGFMVIGFLSMVVGASAAMLMRRKAWWLRLHKRAGFFGTFCVLSGFVAAVAMIDLSGGEHFRITHHYVGFITAALAVFTPLLGVVQLKVRDKAARIRPIHRWSGRVTLLMAFMAVGSGLLIIL
ncbi:MAG: hypothetical protein NT022_00390 [Deltaproteobacteria bacterium]|nr:hypothetical protein [Deltaproteobacteria bacterium]